MKNHSVESLAAGIEAARIQFLKAAEAKKCWPCGCLHESLDAVEVAFQNGDRPEALAQAMDAARARVQPVRYDCLGCAECFPAIAINALGQAGIDVKEGCAAGEVAPRKGWPPLPGSYTVLRYQAPIAVCTLTDERLYTDLVQSRLAGVGIVGMLQTENLGIERLVRNVLANPHLRFLVVCGADSRQKIGHLPGASLVALAKNGVDGSGRILGAPGKRPLLRNLDESTITHFRKTVEIVDLVGQGGLGDVRQAARDCAGRDPGPSDGEHVDPAFPVIAGRIPEHMVFDPSGWVVIDIDRRRGLLRMEHYETSGVIDCVIEGRSAAEVYSTAIEKNLISRLDHAAYVGKELARAEAVLGTEATYVQDAAPERAATIEDPVVVGCGCEGPCGTQPRKTRQRLLTFGLLLVLLAGAGVAWKVGLFTSSNPIAGELPIPGAVYGVESLMRSGIGPSPETVVVEGVVSTIAPADKMFALIDTSEFETCGVTTCAELTLPVRWDGAMPGERETIRATGTIQTVDGKLAFVARNIEPVTPVPAERR